MKKILLLLTVCLGALFMTSCKEVVKSTYYMNPSDVSVNCGSNLYLKIAVVKEIKDSDNEFIFFFGEEDEAIAWFNEKCQKIEQPSFTEGIPVLEDSWMDMNLVDLGQNNKVVTTTRITFAE